MNPSNFNNFGFPMPNVMPNQGGNNMMPNNFDLLQNSMRGFNQQIPMNQMNQMSQMNQGFSPMDFFALANNMIMNNNMYRNPMASSMMNLNQSMSQPNLSQMMGQSFQQNFSVPSKNLDATKSVEDVLSNNMNNLNQFYSSLGLQNKELMPGMNLSNMSNQNANFASSKRSQDFPNETNYLPNKSEFVSSMGSSNGFLSKNSTAQLAGISQYQNEGFDSGQRHQSPLKRSNGVDKVRSDPYLNERQHARGHHADNFEDDGAQPTFKTQEDQRTQRSHFDWEDKPIKSNYISNKHEEVHDDYENEDYGRDSKTNIDFSTRQEYKNPYDEIPIGGKANKRFEDLLQEQLKSNPDAFDPSKSPSRSKPQKTANKTFLKKGTRAFLSNASMKPSKGNDNQKENISSPRNEKSGFQNEVLAFNMKDKSSLKTNNNFVNQQDRSKNREKFETTAAGTQDTTHGTEKPKQKFLSKGGGTGGGIGGFGSTTPSNRQRKSVRNEDDHERDEERSKSQPKGRTNSTKNLKNEQTLRNDKSQEKLRQGRENTLYPDNAIQDNQSFEKEYNFERYAKKSPKGKRIESKARKSPKYQFEEEGEVEDTEHNEAIDDADDGPQVSNLVNKYFYKKKPIKQKEREDEEGGEETEDEKVQKIVNEKIEILNSEIAKFKLENERVKKIRQKHEEMLKNLNRDIAEWNKQKEKELKEFEEWKQEEARKIRNEKKLSERQQKTLSNMPNRKEREEIDNLKKQISKLSEELQLKEKRSKLNIERLKRQIDELEQRNSELVEGLKGYDQYKPKPSTAKGSSASYEINQQNKRSSYKYDLEEEEQEEEPDQEEEDEEYDEDKQVIEERNEDEEEEALEDEEENEDRNESDNENLTYDDIVNKSGNKNDHISPKFVNEKKFDMRQDNRQTTQQNKLNQNGQGYPINQQKNETTKLGRKTEGSEDNMRTSTNPNKKSVSEQEYRFDSNPHYKSYQAAKNESNPIVNQTISPDGKVIDFILISLSYSDPKNLCKWKERSRLP